MAKLVTDQRICTRAFRHWADILVSRSIYTGNAWMIGSTGLVFTNYGHGDEGKITTQVMLGIDPDCEYGVVKVVRPQAARLDKGPATVVGRTDNGHLVLLREGLLQKNSLSRPIRDDFAELSGLTAVPLIVRGKLSRRKYYMVADVDSSPREVVDQTVAFTNACVLARMRAGGGTRIKTEVPPPISYGMDEKWRIIPVSRAGGIAEIKTLQGHVYAELKKLVGADLKKPKANGFCVDAMIEKANLLIEIKTSSSAHAIYEGVGQLLLYPSLIGIVPKPETALLVPNLHLKNVLRDALKKEGILLFHYDIEEVVGKKPRIGFSPELIARCRHQST